MSQQPAQTGSQELGKRLQNGDVVAGNYLSDLFAQQGFLDDAQRIYETNQAYIQGWTDVMNTLSSEFTPRYFDENSNRWKDSITNQYAKNPANDETFLARARELRLINS